MRDDFSEKVKRDLAGRAGYKCSNPNCRISTIEAKYAAEGTVSIGEAAHICAASEGGMRYNANMSSEERSSADNGVWLCRNCAAMIDRDSIYTVAMLYKWKYDAETQASSINSFGVSKFDRDVLGEISCVCESSNVKYMLKEHDFHSDFQRTYLDPLFDLWEKLENPSMKVQNTKIASLIEELIRMIRKLRGLVALKGGPTTYGNGSFIIDFEQDQIECNNICSAIWNQYTGIIQYSKNFV